MGKLKAFDKTKLKYNTNNTIVIIAFLVVVLLVNVVLGALVAKYPLKIDLTRNKLYSLSEQTKEILGGVKDDITIYYVQQKNLPDQQIVEAVQLYEKTSPRVKMEILDEAEKNPDFLNTNGVREYNSLVVINQNNKKSRTIAYSDLYARSSNAAGGVSVSASQVEGQVTAAISYVTSADTPKVYYTQGHGEISSFQVPKNTLASENIEASPLDLLTQEIPADADLVIIPGPSIDFETASLAKIDAYLEKGGKVQFYASPSAQCPSLTGYFYDEWGIKLEFDAAFDNDSQHNISMSSGNAAYTYLLPDVKEHDITSYILNNDGRIIWPCQTFSNTITLEEKDGVEQVPLLTTSADGVSYSMEALLNSDGSTRPEAYREGALNLLVYARKNPLNNNEVTARLLVCGTLEPLFEQGGDVFMNKELLIKSINYMAGFEDAPVLVQPKKMADETLSVNALEATLYNIILIGVLPLALFVSGIVVFIRRRHL